jgi:hypothetical protein
VGTLQTHTKEINGAGDCFIGSLLVSRFNKVRRTIGNLPMRTLLQNMHVAFQIPYVYDYITKLCRRQAEIIHNHENENVRNIRQGETPHRKHKRLKLGSGHLYDRSSV